MGREIDKSVIGKENTNWIVIDVFRKNNHTYYKCQCKCGCKEEVDIRNDNFEIYNKICKYKKSLIPPKPLKHVPRETLKSRLIGQTFGNLYVKSFYGYNKHKQIVYECECQCKDKTIVYATYTDLTHSKKDNCGCLYKLKQREAHKKENTYNLNGKYGIGWTTNTNQEFYFDLEDYDKIKNYCWNESSGGYIVANDENKKHIKQHRIIMGVTNPKDKIDHIYHNLKDNRKSELRITTNQQNSFNHVLHANNTSGVSGVNWDSEKSLWRARIFINKKGIHLGYFEDFNKAVIKREKAEDLYFKEYKYEVI